MKTITLYTKINSLPEYLRKEANDFIDFLLTKKKVQKPGKMRKAGFLKGQIEMGHDFDEPLDDFNEYMQ